AGRHGELGQSRGAAGAGRGACRDGRRELRRRQRRRRPALGRGASGGARRRDAGAVRRDRRRGLRSRGRHPARRHPRRVLGADAGGLRHAQRDRPGGRVSGGALGDIVARHHRAQQPGDRPGRRRPGAGGGHRTGDRRLRRRIPAARRGVDDVPHPRGRLGPERGQLLHRQRHPQRVLRRSRPDDPRERGRSLGGQRPARTDRQRGASRRVRRGRGHRHLRRPGGGRRAEERSAALADARRGQRGDRFAGERSARDGGEPDAAGHLVGSGRLRRPARRGCRQGVVTTTEATSAGGVAQLRRPRRMRRRWLLAVVAVLVVLMAVSVAVGSREVGWADIVAALGGSADGLDRAAVSVRIPRTVLAVTVGAALAVSGALMQGVTRNPLADPGILGVNKGAALAVVNGIAWLGLTASNGYIWTAIVGAGISAVFVYVIGSLGRGGPMPLKLALAGAATSAAFVSFITAIALPRNDIGANVRSWQIGGVGGASFDRIGQLTPFLVAGFVICLLSARGMNTLALGDDVAAGLGERVALTRAVAALGAVLLCGASTAIAGPIGFVGLVIPHLCRLLVGPDHRWLLPFSALTGAGLLTAADVLGRIVARPSEIDVGIVTALIGAPFFIVVVRRHKVRAL